MMTDGKKPFYGNYLSAENNSKKERSDDEGCRESRIQTNPGIQEDSGGGQQTPGDGLLSKYLKENYYPHIRANCAPKTGVSYRNAMNHFIRICGDKVMKKYTRKNIQDYKIYRYDKYGIQKIIINIEMRSIKSAFYWAYKNEMLNRMPYKGQDYLFEAKANRRAFEEFEIKKLFRVTEGKMIGLIVRLAYYTGMRIGEMSGYYLANGQSRRQVYSASSRNYQSELLPGCTIE